MLFGFGDNLRDTHSNWVNCSCQMHLIKMFFNDSILRAVEIYIIKTEILFKRVLHIAGICVNI